MKLSEYTGYLRRFGFFYTLREIYYRFFSNILEKRLCFKRDRDTLAFLKRYLGNNKKSSLPPLPLKDIKPKVWTCWFQGYDNAPPIVKACIIAMRKYTHPYEVIVLTEETIADYVVMPEHIMKKYKSGIIPTAQFSDLLRTLLLINYGGVWLDATVLLTKPIPQIILDSEFFVFQTSILYPEIQPCSNWFIAAKRNNSILLKVFDVLVSYWKDKDNLVNYFIYHVAVRLVITYDEEARRFWEKIPYKNNSDPHLLQHKLFDEIDAGMREYIWDFSFAHKLTYKFGDDSLPQRPNTYYKYILNASLKEGQNPGSMV